MVFFILIAIMINKNMVVEQSSSIMTSTRFPSIEKLRHVVYNVQFDLGDACPSTVSLVGTTKLHGIHADVVISSDSSVRLQSRNILELTLENDVCSFARWMIPHRDTMLEIRDAFHRRYCQLNPGTTIDPAFPLLIAGEFIGIGIQKGVAIAKLTKRFVILGACINNRWLPDQPYGDICAEDKDVYNIVRGGLFHIDLQLEQLAATEAEIKNLVEAVE